MSKKYVLIGLLLLLLSSPLGLSHAAIFTENFNDAVGFSPILTDRPHSEKWNPTNYYIGATATDPQWTFSGQAYVAENGNDTANKAILLNESPFGSMITSSPISVISGTNYLLAFDHWGDNRSGGTYAFRVLLNGSPLSTISRTYNVPGPGETITIPFTASSESMSLSFEATSSIGQASPIFDNISVSNVPIPAAVWLLGSGLLGLVVIRRKFRK